MATTSKPATPRNAVVTGDAVSVTITWNMTSAQMLQYEIWSVSPSGTRTLVKSGTQGSPSMHVTLPVASLIAPGAWTFELYSVDGLGTKSDPAVLHWTVVAAPPSAVVTPTGDVWTATIGGNAVECYIVKDSLTVHMGKDAPEVFGQAGAGTASFEIYGEPRDSRGNLDTFESGEVVVVRRDGAVVWTGWVSDEDRTWSKTSKTSRVNAVGPRSRLERVTHIPTTLPPAWWPDAGTTVSGMGQVFYKLIAQLDTSRFGGASATTLFTDGSAGRDIYYTARTMYFGGYELPKAMDLLDGAANATFSRVWETRAGGITVIGCPYYRGQIPGAWAADLVTITCDQVTAPVQIRKDGSTRVNRWVASVGDRHEGDPVAPGNAPVSVDTPFDDAYSEARYGAMEYSPSPMMNMSSTTEAQKHFNHVVEMLGEPREQVDAWVIDKANVPAALWDRLLHLSLGQPVQFINLPAGLFRDNRTIFSGFAYGWQLTGTDKITLTVVDSRVQTQKSMSVVSGGVAQLKTLTFDPRIDAPDTATTTAAGFQVDGVASGSAKISEFAAQWSRKTPGTINGSKFTLESHHQYTLSSVGGVVGATGPTTRHQVVEFTAVKPMFGNEFTQATAAGATTLPPPFTCVVAPIAFDFELFVEAYLGTWHAANLISGTPKSVPFFTAKGQMNVGTWAAEFDVVAGSTVTVVVGVNFYPHSGPRDVSAVAAFTGFSTVTKLYTS